MSEQKGVFTHLDQIGVVVKDLEKVRKAMKQIFGLDPSSEGLFTYNKANIRGNVVDANAKGLFYNFNNIQLEFMCPTEGASTWQEFADEVGEGLHHIRFNVDNHNAAEQAMTNYGIKSSFTGESMRGGGRKFAYYDSLPELGFILETINFREIDKDE